MSEAGPIASAAASAAACADALITRLDGRIRLALPLGLGKPAALVNALYRRVRDDPTLELTLFTALTLEVPRARSELEARLLGPLVERLYAGVPTLDYATDQRAGRLPDNVRVIEFYLRPGAYLNVPDAQQNYTSINYTHAARDLVARGVNVVAQMVARHPRAAALSLSCNPDVTLDLLDEAARAGGDLPLLIGEVNAHLPYMPGEAELPVTAFDWIIDDPAGHAPLFPVPAQPVPLIEHAIGLQVAALVRDGGTLQVGIGSLGDAVAYALGLRRTDNAAFRALVAALPGSEPGSSGLAAELDDLPEGLFGASEMLVEGFLHLRTRGVLRRCVADGVYLQAGFFLGSARFYEALRRLPAHERRGIAMSRISNTNHLLGDEARKRAERQHARFVNTAMMMTLTGAAVSDGLADGRVVSGVGGQYNFVAMAHELRDARSILILRATRSAGGTVTSNVVPQYGHVTIPRHLRDLVVTEYGVADLRGKSDRDVIAALLNIADSRFQPQLREAAVAAGKLPADHEIPERCRNNRPEVLASALRDTGLLGRLPWYPLGSDFTAEEAALTVALQALAERAGDRRALLATAWSGWRRGPATGAAALGALARLGLARPRGLRERFYRALLEAALDEVAAAGRPLVEEHGMLSGETDPGLCFGSGRA